MSYIIQYQFRPTWIGPEQPVFIRDIDKREPWHFGITSERRDALTFEDEALAQKAAIVLIKGRGRHDRLTGSMETIDVTTGKSTPVVFQDIF